MSIKEQIREAVFGLYRSKQLEGKFSSPTYDSVSKNIVYLELLTADKTTESLKIIFPAQYPDKSPKIELKSQQLNNLCYSSLTGEKYNKSITLSMIILDYYSQINLISNNQKIFLNNVKKDEQQQQQEQNSQQISKQKIIKKQINHKHNTTNPDKQTTETKNLNRHFRSKLRDILKQFNKQKIKGYEELQSLFNSNRVGFQDIRKALKNEDFNKEIKNYMDSGRFLHKILIGMMGIKSKKLMIKYYRYMLSAVYETDKFSKWKYD